MTRDENRAESGASTPSAGSIRRLPDALVDQIAAGEVVERPASVVKELVENSLDAGASRVRIELREGGAAFAAVTDDGRGMHAADARLALERHATSKLASLADLEEIGTFGFRGEALPAIASVSRLRLRTRRAEDEQGVELVVEQGRLVAERGASAAAGTRVEVADLFAAVPARRKFLKQASTEWGHAADWLARCALVRTDVHFEVHRDGRLAFAWPAVGNPLDRVASVLSEDDAAALVRAQVESPAARLDALVSRPDRSRPTANGLYLFVNGRPVRDRLLRHALLEAYRDVLPRGRFPTALLFLEVGRGGVDVNVHPAKWEVRFADPASVHALVRRAVREALAARAWLGAPAAHAGSVPLHAPSSAPLRAPLAARVRDAPSEPLFAAAPAAERLRFADLRPLGQLLATYLLVESKEGLLLVDQHAAHERVLYERLRAEWTAARVESQRLLWPASVALAPSAAAALAGAAETVARLGFELEPFGEGAVMVRAVPGLLAERDAAALVRELADALESTESAAAMDAQRALEARALAPADRLFATLACHSARRAGEPLELAEQQALLDALDAIPWAPTCPHGRPVAVPIDRAEIERRFGRR